MTYDPSAVLNNLLTRKANLAAEIAAFAGGTAPDLPNAQGGGSHDWQGYVQKRLDQIIQIDQAIATLQGPYEILQQGMT